MLLHRGLLWVVGASWPADSIDRERARRRVSRATARTAFVSGMSEAVVVGALVSLVGAVLALALLPGRRASAAVAAAPTGRTAGAHAATA